jgi:V8-like Glu-specific endopeptidase
MRLPRTTPASKSPRALAGILVIVALLATPAWAAAAPYHLTRSPTGFWTAARIQRALRSDSMEHRRQPRSHRASASSLQVLEPTAPTYRTNGRIFGRDPGIGLYSCSGTSLATPSQSMVLTAGHCVYEEGRYGTNLVFIPAYGHKERPFGTFAGETAILPRPWTHGENSDFDLAAIQVAPGSLGTLTATVGAKGWTSSRSRFAELQIFGYPAGALGGEEMRSCLTHGSGSDASLNFLFGPPPLSANCDMASGSSGGGWLVEGGTLLDGVTSYHHIGHNIRHYSPYFGPQIDKFLRRLA